MTEPETLIAIAIKSFNWSNYGFDDIEDLIESDLDGQEWIPDLASNIANVLRYVSLGD